MDRSKFIRRLIKTLASLFLFLPPLAACLYWSHIEKEELKPFAEFRFQGLEDISSEAVSAIYGSTNSWYESTKDNFSTQFQKKKPVSDIENFNEQISAGVVEKLRIFSYLPYHRVCLTNRNKIFINDGIAEQQPAQVGGIAIHQDGGYDFYAEKGTADCKIVSIARFREASSSSEIGYTIFFTLDQEENNKRLRGESYIADMATTTIEMQDSLIEISLPWWIIALAYFFLLFAWSFVFFQYGKIVEFLLNALRTRPI